MGVILALLQMGRMEVLLQLVDMVVLRRAAPVGMVR